jgi:hypothetical protein
VLGEGSRASFAKVSADISSGDLEVRNVDEFGDCALAERCGRRTAVWLAV